MQKPPARWRLSEGSCRLLIPQMVARDGIEPPTPAFSGPRSTTELSGLGITLVVGDRQEPPCVTIYICRPGLYQGSLSPSGEPATQTQSKYSNLRPYRQMIRLAISFLILHREGRPCSHASIPFLLRSFSA